MKNNYSKGIITLIICVLIFAQNDLKAQSDSDSESQFLALRVGPKVGGVLSHFDGSGTEKGSVWGYNVGGFASIDLFSGFLSVQGEVLYSSQGGYRNDYTDNQVNYTNRKIVINSIEVPVVGKLRLLSLGNTSFKFLGGVSYSFISYIEESGQSGDLSYSGAVTSYYNLNQVNLKTGIEGEFELIGKTFLADISYTHGLSNINKYSSLTGTASEFPSATGDVYLRYFSLNVAMVLLGK